MGTSLPCQCHSSLFCVGFQPKASPMALTSHGASSHCYERQCRKIHAAWDKLGLLACDMARWSPVERQRIREAYRAIYGDDIVEQLGSSREVPVCDALHMWMLEPHEHDAVVLRDAIERSETDYRALVEMYTRRKSNHLFFTKQAYVAKFKTHLEQDVISLEPSHPYQRILVALAALHRSHHQEVSQHIAKCDAKKLYEAVKASAGTTNEASILEMFSKRSILQLRLAFSSYKQIYGHDFTKALKRESSGEFEESLGVVIQCMCDPFEYYSEMIFLSLRGGSTERRVLTRVMIGSVEAGMEEVRKALEKRYGIKLQDAIHESIEDGDYRDFLLALTGGVSSNQ